MNCECAREAISALLDREPVEIERSALEGHLDQCASCRAWQEEAHEVTRRARLATARPVPSPDGSLLAAVAAIERGGPWWMTLASLRGALLVVALGQIALSLPELVSGTYRGAPMHVAHEMGALDLALATGFLVAAWRPARAQGMRALVGCAALLLVVTAVIDMIAGRTGLSDEAPHVLVVAGWLLLRPISRLAPAREDTGLRVRRLVRAHLEQRRARAVGRWDANPVPEKDERVVREHPAEIPADEPLPRRAADGA